MPRKNRAIRFSDDEWALAEREAGRRSMDRSAFIRAVATGALDPARQRGRQEIIAELFRVGTHVKQLKERYDEAETEGPIGGDFEHDSVALGSVLDDLKTTLEELGAYRGTDPESGDEGAAESYETKAENRRESGSESGIESGGESGNTGSDEGAA